LKISAKLAAADPSNAQWQRDLSLSWERIGTVRQAQGDLTGAAQAYDDARTITAKLAAADPSNAQWQRDLAVSWSQLGEVRQAQGDLAGALKNYEESLAIRQRLLDQAPDDTQRRLDLSYILNSVGWLRATADSTSLRDPKAAVVIAKQAVELSESKEPATLDTLAMAYFSAGELNRAVETAQQALALIPVPPPPELVAVHDEVRSHLAEFRTAAQRRREHGG
jgi:tetratricopeptide (TPR) repeat protein